MYTVIVVLCKRQFTFQFKYTHETQFNQLKLSENQMMFNLSFNFYYN